MEINAIELIKKMRMDDDGFEDELKNAESKIENNDDRADEEILSIYAKWLIEKEVKYLTEEMDTSLNNILEAVKTIESPEIKSRLLTYIAIILSGADIDKGKYVANKARIYVEKIEEVYLRYEILIEVIGAMAKCDIDEALNMAKEIKNDFWRGIAIGKVACEVSKFNLKNALTIINNIQHKFSKSITLTAIAKITAKKDTDEAVSIAMGIDDDDKKNRALEYVTEEVSDIKGKSIVNEMIEEIENYVEVDIDEITEAIYKTDEIDEKIERAKIATLVIVNLPLIKAYIKAKQENKIMEFVEVMETQDIDKISEYIKS